MWLRPSWYPVHLLNGPNTPNLLHSTPSILPTCLTCLIVVYLDKIISSPSLSSTCNGFFFCCIGKKGIPGACFVEVVQTPNVSPTTRSWSERFPWNFPIVGLSLSHHYGDHSCPFLRKYSIRGSICVQSFDAICVDVGGGCWLDLC